MTPIDNIFPDPLQIEDNCDSTYTLLHPFRAILTTGETITVPVGFITDLLSIPQIFTNILPRDGKFGRAAVIHDYLYSICDRSRDEADHILSELLAHLGCPRLTVDIIYDAVHEFGASHYGK